MKVRKNMEIGNIVQHDRPRLVHIPVIFSENTFPKVLVTREAVQGMYEHAYCGITCGEIGGYLLGFPARDIQRETYATYIEKAIPAICESTSIHVTMLSESLREVESVRKKDGTILVGYYHSHPGLGIFLSEEDNRNFRNFHSETYQIAVVVDPTKTPSATLEQDFGWIGFFGWDKAGKPVRLPSDNVVFVDGRPEPFSSYHPVVIVAKDIALALKLLQTSSDLGNGGLLGDVVDMAGVSSALVTRIYPCPLECLPAYFDDLGRETSGINASGTSNREVRRRKPIGFYCTEDRLINLLHGVGWFQQLWRWYLLRRLVRCCGELCLVALTTGSFDQRTLSFYTWSPKQKQFQEVPHNQVLFE